MLEDQGRAHEVNTVSGPPGRGIDPAPYRSGSQAGRVREHRQGRARVHLRRVLQRRGLAMGRPSMASEESLVVGARGEVGAVSLFGAVAEGIPIPVGDLGRRGRREGGAAVRVRSRAAASSAR